MWTDNFVPLCFSYFTPLLPRPCLALVMLGLLSALPSWFPVVVEGFTPFCLHLWASSEHAEIRRKRTPSTNSGLLQCVFNVEFNWDFKHLPHHGTECLVFLRHLDVLSISQLSVLTSAFLSHSLGASFTWMWYKHKKTRRFSGEYVLSCCCKTSASFTLVLERLSVRPGRMSAHSFWGDVSFLLPPLLRSGFLQDSSPQMLLCCPIHTHCFRFRHSVLTKT